MTRLTITVIGAGVLGLWQAFELARRGHAVTVLESRSEHETGTASRLAGAMLAPYCEAEAAEPLVEELGLEGLRLWRQAYAGVVQRGTLVLAAVRDQGELARYARMTRGHRWIDAGGVAELEPDLARRFPRALLFAEEAHLAPRPALQFLIEELRRLGASLKFESTAVDESRLSSGTGWIIDCRGMPLGSGAVGSGLRDLRGVRGEMIVLRAPDIALSRPVRLLHPRFPLYVVPWGDSRFMVGATLIERHDSGPVTVRSALDLLGTAYAVHPGFAEAEITELSAGVRPAFADNLPRVAVEGRRLYVNGAYRHGFLLAPVLARAVADHVERGQTDPRLFRTG